MREVVGRDPLARLDGGCLGFGQLGLRDLQLGDDPGVAIHDESLLQELEEVT